MTYNLHVYSRDGCARRDEWISEWIGRYGFSEEFGGFFFDNVNDGDNCMNRDDVFRIFNGQFLFCFGVHFNTKQF